MSLRARIYFYRGAYLRAPGISPILNIQKIIMQLYTYTDTRQIEDCILIFFSSFGTEPMCIPIILEWCRLEPRVLRKFR